MFFPVIRWHTYLSQSVNYGSEEAGISFSSADGELASFG